MTNENRSQTAEIIPFRPRAASNNGFLRFDVKAVANSKEKQVKANICFDSWYHEAEIVNEARPEKTS